MNKSLYEISDELQQIINYIEDSGGEINEEIEEALNISQEELEEKVDAYCNLIAMTNSDIECCKNEKKRINDLQNTRKNLVEKLKERLLKATETFGDDGKSGNKVLTFPLHKLYTRNTKSLVVNEERIKILGDYTRRYVCELYREGVLVQGEEIDYSGMIAAINTMIKSELGEDFEPFTVADFTQLKFKVTTEIPFTDFMLGRCEYSKDLISDPMIDCEYSIYEDVVKSSLENQPDIKYTIGNIETKTSLTIK